MSVYRASDDAQRIAVSAAARTDAGRCREHNEDAFLLSDLARDACYGAMAARIALEVPLALAMGVYDGSGGGSSPDAASRLAARAVHASLARPAPRDAGELEPRLVAALEHAGRQVLEQARRSPAHRGSGTTATVAALCDDRAVLAQVGGSRAYLFRGGVLSQVTRDQTLVQTLLDENKLTREEAKTFAHRNALVQALGVRERLRVAISTIALRRDDVLLLCTDGLSELVDDAAIRAALDAEGDLDEACRALIDAACRAGGTDNVTVLVARFSGPWLAPFTAAEAAG